MEPVRLNTVKGDVEKAVEYREELSKLLTPICDLCTRARQQDKIDLQFQLSPDAMGKFFIADIKTLKNLL